MDRKELEANLEATNATLQDARDAVIDEIQKIFDSVITNDSIKIDCDDKYAKIEVPIPGKMYGHTIDVYYDKDWDDGNRKIKLNIGTFGSFDSSMKPEIDFYIVAGQLASNLPKMQEMFDAIDFKTLDDARHAYWNAMHKLEEFDKVIHDAEEAKKRQEVESKLVPGAKIKVGIDHWSNVDVLNEIEKLTTKRIYFKSGDRRCMDKDDAINHFFLNRNPWTFA